MPEATLDLQLTGKSTHPIKGSPRLLLSIANSQLSQGKPPWVPPGVRGSRGERCREESWLQEQRIYLLYKSYLAEGRSCSACLGKTRQGSFARGGNGPYCVESGGSVGNRSHELTFPRLVHHPKQFWFLKMPQRGAQLLCREGHSGGWVSLLSGLKLLLCCGPSVTHPTLPAAILKSLSLFRGKKLLFCIA